MSVNEKLTAIADAIRGKTGGTDALTLDGMAAAIAGIEAGGATVVQGSITYAEDGEVYVPADVSVMNGQVPSLAILYRSKNTFVSSTSSTDLGMSVVVATNTTVGVISHNGYTVASYLLSSGKSVLPFIGTSVYSSASDGLRFFSSSAAIGGHTYKYILIWGLELV